MTGVARFDGDGSGRPRVIGSDQGYQGDQGLPRWPWITGGGLI